MRHKEKFLMSSTAGAANQRAAYEEVINNPLNRIVSTMTDKETHKTMEEGNLVCLVEEIYEIVEWESEELDLSTPMR